MVALAWPVLSAILKRTILGPLLSKWTGTGLGVALGVVGVGLAGWHIWRVVTSDDGPPRYTARQAAAACDSAWLQAENDTLKADLQRLAARLAERGERLAELTATVDNLQFEQEAALAHALDPDRVVVPPGDGWLLARAKRTGAAAAAGAGGR